MPRTDLGFSSSAWLRLGAAALFMTAVLAGTVLVTRAGGSLVPQAQTAPPATASAAAGRLVLEATYPVARWTVQVQGRDVGGTATGAQRWEGEVPAVAGSLFLQAEAADLGSAAPVALRWSLAGRAGIFWGEGAVAETLALAPAVPAAGAR
jgi:hypothetical protein